MNIDILIPLLVALVAAIPGIAALRSNSRKTDADANSIEVGALRDTVKTLQENADRLRTDVSESRQRIEELERIKDEHERQIEALKKESEAFKKESNEAHAEVISLTREFGKLQQNFLEAQRAKELLQATVIEKERMIAERDRIILGLRSKITELDTERDRIISGLRGRIVELETQVATLKEKVNGTV